MAATPIQLETTELLNRNINLLQAGSSVTIDISSPAGKKGKFRTTFIGFLPKNYVLIQFPDSSKLGSFAQYVVPGVSITVRGLVEGREGAVVGFVSNVRQTLQTPSRLMVLEFPYKVSLQYLRSSIRVDTDIKVKVKVANDYFEAKVSDISISGCQVLVHNALSLMMANDKPIEVIIEDFLGKKNLKLPGSICNVKKQSNDVSLGIKFGEESKDSVSEVIQYAVSVES